MNKFAFEFKKKKNKRCLNVKLAIKVFHPASSIKIRMTAKVSIKNEKIRNC